MVAKWIKRGVLAVVSVCVVGGLLFGRDLASYLRTSLGSVQNAVKNEIPTEFELGRARDLLEQIIPEMQANIRLIAQEEVEIAALKSDLEQGVKGLVEERQRIQKISGMLNDTHTPSYTIGDLQYSREQLKEDLARRFDQFKEAEVVLAGKRRLLETREKSLQAAQQLLERTRSQKILLAQKIEALDSQHRLIQAAAVGSRLELDNSKLAQTEKLISQIKKRLDVAERVLAHESRFVQPMAIDTISEKELLGQVEEYFTAPAQPGKTTGEDADRPALLTPPGLPR